jgi:YfiH family protein
MITSDILSASNIKHGFFTRLGGVSDGLYASLNCGFGSEDPPENVTENRSRVAGSLGVEPGKLLTTYQYHGSEVVVASKSWTDRDRPRADAMVTDTPGLALGILTADCVPVLFADPQVGIIGAAHSGWQGALGGVLGATVVAMENLGARRSGIRAVIGPAISQIAYQVGPEFRDTFDDRDPDSDEFFRDDMESGRFLFDLPGYAAALLGRENIGAITNLHLCTYGEEPRFFSYRRATHRNEPDYGRQISAIALSE